MIPPLEEVERLVRQGEAARRLLADESFIEVVNALSDFHLSALVAAPTGPQHIDTRDHHHVMLHALRELHLEIAGRVDALETFEREQNQEDIE